MSCVEIVRLGDDAGDEDSLGDVLPERAVVCSDVCDSTCVDVWADVCDGAVVEALDVT